MKTVKAYVLRSGEKRPRTVRLVKDEARSNVTSPGGRKFIILRSDLAGIKLGSFRSVQLYTRDSGYLTGQGFWIQVNAVLPRKTRELSIGCTHFNKTETKKMVRWANAKPKAK